ncbi:MAG: hypothetical protein GKR91_05530 [Pseudomonadales bacterium]|nr:hypothetical protein [Pseudomonadales bacterium]
MNNLDYKKLEDSSESRIQFDSDGERSLSLNLDERVVNLNTSTTGASNTAVGIDILNTNESGIAEWDINFGIMDQQFIGVDISWAGTDLSIENELNEQRLEEFNNKHKVTFLNLVMEDSLESGMISPADRLVKQLMRENSTVAKEWLNRLFINNFKDENVCLGILSVLSVLSGLDYNVVYPQGQTIAIAALAHTNAEVREFAICAFEYWESKDAIPILAELHCAENWLNDYKSSVVDYLKDL